ncbi:Phosphatidate phosphohydrolase 3 [Cladobotryum mycophilum]|uniref:Phosphatidate phosphohydrolase 3 n=1 Tax=Cladobotryum mycophilum TaxID=491253 RepID=A0ABR0S639_9HYPO
MPPYQKMGFGPESIKKSFSFRLLASYTFDWIILIVIAVIGYVLGRITPNKRPFSLVDPNISFPFTENETVPDWLLFVLCAVVPVAVIFSLVWRRKLWELHIGWLGLLMSVGCGFFFVSGIKNMCGKPRPDLLARCLPDIENAAKYVIGGFKGEAAFGSNIGQLYSADICQQTDKAKLDDGFRSYPSGHSAASAGGLIYLSLFLASKFAVTFPFVASDGGSADHSVHAAFPSRLPLPADVYDRDDASPMTKVGSRNARHNVTVQALRRQAAAAPVYLLAITVAPFCLAIFIAASRWFDFRHHGFDILFGFVIGIITAIFSFRYYHLPITDGAGWAWGPRSGDRAFWAGVGRLGYVNEKDADRRVRNDLGESADVDVHTTTHLAAPGGLNQRSGTLRPEPFQDVELSNLEAQGGVKHGIDSRI